MQIRKKDIAVIGLSGKFPKSYTLQQFWKNLAQGKELIHFYDEKESEAHMINASSFINNAGSFDHAFFGYTKDEATLMDPQIRILHEYVWSALEDAGYNPLSYLKKIGLYVSASDNLNWRAHVMMNPSDRVNPFFAEQISNSKFISTLISYSLNLKGPSYFLDTACSSSLANVHIACRNLLLKECSIAVAAGVSVNTKADKGYTHYEGMILSKDGHCRTFDKDSSGTISAEGVGVIVLKRMEDAVNDGDHIYAVIRGTAVNNDGKRKVGYTAPSVIGQFECIKLAQRVAGVQPSEISYVEAHGTATKLGDPIEIEALNRAFNNDQNHSCAIGSLKSNLGHMDAAAGIGGFIKTTLSLYHKKLVPSLHFKEANPDIDFASGPFYVNTEVKDWQTKNQAPRIAGVSSFGIGGTNAHAIVEESPLIRSQRTDQKYKLFPFSAKTKTSLADYKTHLTEFITEFPKLSLSDVVHTLEQRTQDMPYRDFIVCKHGIQVSGKKTEIPSKLQRSASVTFMFPGQGNQYFSMGKDLYKSNELFTSILDQGFEILQQLTGENIKDFMGLETSKEIDPTLINDTRYTQPILFLFEYALAKLVMNVGITPNQMIGHSLGEYVAACIGGVFSLEDGLKIVTERARLMNQLEVGAMVHVNVDVSAVQDYLNDTLDIAVINTENTCVIAGTIKDMDTFTEILKAESIAHIRLKTSHAFHSHMMDAMLEEYKEVLNSIHLSVSKFPIVSNITGVYLLDQEATSTKYWVNHIRQTVNFAKGTQFLLKKKNGIFIELGPGKSLSSFMQKNSDFQEDHRVVNMVRHPKEHENDEYFFLQGLGQVWQYGVDIQWGALCEEVERNKIPIPTYCFDRIQFPVKVAPYKQLQNTLGIKSSNTESKEWTYKKGWREITEMLHKRKDDEFFVYLLSDNQIFNDVQTSLEKESSAYIIVKAGDVFICENDHTMTINPHQPSHYEELYNILLKKASGKNLHVRHSWSLSEDLSENDTLSFGYFSLLEIARTLLKNEDFSEVRIDCLIANSFSVLGDESLSPLNTTIHSALKVMSKEYEQLTTRCIEVNLPNANLPLIEEVLHSSLQKECIAIRGNKLWEPYYQELPLKQTVNSYESFKQRGVYLITGASGGIGTAVSSYLREQYDARVLLAVRRNPSDEFKSWVEQQNGAAHYIIDDLSNNSSLRNKIQEALTQWDQQLDGVFHTAGVADNAGLIAKRMASDCLQVFQPKIQGTLNLSKAIESSKPDFVVLFSSLASIFAPYGQVGYVAANAFQNAFAKSRSDQETQYISVIWDTWKESGMAVRVMRQNGISMKNIQGISNAEAMSILESVVHQKRMKEVIVSKNDLNALVSKYENEKPQKFLAEQENPRTEDSPTIERPNLEIEYTPPTNEMEIAICQLMESFFGFDRIGIHDDFFDLGGDSLKAMVLVKKIQEEFDYSLTLGLFFEKPTIAHLAKEISLARDLKALQGNTNSKNTIVI